MVETLVLEPVLDMQATGRLAAQLGSLQRPVVLDATQVSHLGGLAAQLLLSARLTAGPDPARLRVTGASPAFLGGLRRLGIDPAQFTG